jgi:chemotaxis-related protein WspD
MNEHAGTTAEAALLHIDDCWNRIGVRGDHSCPALENYGHCRNCPVQASVAADLLTSVRSGQYLAEWTRHVAEPKSLKERDTESAVIFRVGVEWLALPTSVVQEVADPKPVHSVPHRRNGVVLGLTSVRGELLVCVSLPLVLGLQPPAASTETSRTVYRRFLLIRRDEVRAVCPVDEVHGVHRFPPSALREIPATLAKATGRYSRSLLPWQERSVGLIDEQLLFATLRRSLA